MVTRRPEPPRTPEPVVKREKLKYLSPLEITEKTTKGQLPVINGWNEMRARLIEIGEMEREP